MELNPILKEVIARYGFAGELEECCSYGNGHINETYHLRYKKEQGDRRYILQKMNKTVFKDPVGLMENLMGVTGWLKDTILKNGGDAERETLTVVPTADGAGYCVDSEGEYWRVFLFIDNAVCYEAAETEEIFYESAVSFGNFQRLLADYPADTLHETIKDFHDTWKRFQRFEDVVKADVCGRAASVQPEIQFVLDRKELSRVLCRQQEEGLLPLRVTHNDTKLNNVLFDRDTGKGVCVIDLDTVMPGLSVNDFGDAIRFGASSAAEDEPDLSKVYFDLHLYEEYVKGYIKGCAGALTDQELDMLPIGAIMMTFECGMRFLTDHLEGDVYFRIHRENHNLDRCRTQFRLVKDMEENLPQMKAIVDKYR